MQQLYFILLDFNIDTETNIQWALLIETNHRKTWYLEIAELKVKTAGEDHQE